MSAVTLVPKFLPAATDWVKLPVPFEVVMVPQVTPQATLPLTVIFKAPLPWSKPLVIVRSPAAVRLLVVGFQVPPLPSKVRLKKFEPPVLIVLVPLVLVNLTVPEL